MSMQNVQKIVFVVLGVVGSMQAALPPVITHPSQIDWTALGVEYALAGDKTPDAIARELVNARTNKDIRGQQMALGQLAHTINRGDANQETLAIMASAFEHGNVVSEKNQQLAAFLMDFVGARAYRDAQEKGFLFGSRVKDASTQTDDLEASEADRESQIQDLRAALAEQLPAAQAASAQAAAAQAPRVAAVKKRRKDAASSPLASPAARAAAAAREAQRAQQNHELVADLNARKAGENIVFECLAPREAEQQAAAAQHESVQIPVHVVAVAAEQSAPTVPVAPKKSYLQAAKDAVSSALGMAPVSAAAAEEVVVQQTQDMNPVKRVANASENKQRSQRRAHKAGTKSESQPATKVLPVEGAAPAIATSNPFAALPVEEVSAVFQAAPRVERKDSVQSAASSVVGASEGSAVSVNSADALVHALDHKDASELYALLQANFEVIASEAGLEDKQEAFNRISTILCNSDVKHPAREQVAAFVASGDHNGIFACFDSIELNGEAASLMVKKGLKSPDLSAEERGKLVYVAAHVALLENNDAVRMEHLKEAAKYGHKRAQNDLLAIAVSLSAQGEHAQARAIFVPLVAAGVELPEHARLHYAQCMAEHDRLKEKAVAVRQAKRAGGAMASQGARAGSVVVMPIDSEVSKQFKELHKKFEQSKKFAEMNSSNPDLQIAFVKKGKELLQQMAMLPVFIDGEWRQICTRHVDLLEAVVTVARDKKDLLKEHCAKVQLFEAYVDAENFARAQELFFELVQPLSYWTQPENADLFATLRKFSEKEPEKSAEIGACKKNMAVKLYQLAEKVSPRDKPAIEKLLVEIKEKDCAMLGMTCDELSDGGIRITMPDGTIVTAPADLAQTVFDECVQTILNAQAATHKSKAGASADA